MSAFSHLVVRILETAEKESGLAFTREQRLEIERKIVNEFAGEQVYVGKRHRPLGPNFVTGYQGGQAAPTVRTIMRENGVSRRTAYRWVRNR